MIIVMNTTESTGREQRHGHPPEDLPLGGAVGSRRLEHLSRHRREPGGDHHHGEAGPDPDVGDHQRGRDQLRPEPGEAAPRFREGLRRDAGVVGARARPPRSRTCRRRPPPPSSRPCSRRRAAARSRPAGRARPSRPCPATPPPGLKSRQTTPCDVTRRGGFGSTACFAAVGTWLGRDAGQPEQRDAARVERRLQRHPRLRRSRGGSASTGSASESEPGGLNTS